MLDIKLIRSDPDFVKAGLKRRGKDYDREIDEILKIDRQRREINSQADRLRCEQNAANNEIARMRQTTGLTEEIMARMKRISGILKGHNEDIAKLEKSQNDLVCLLPNLPHESVPMGIDETENKEIRRWGKPREFNFKPDSHWDLGAKLGIIDPARAAKVTGSRFHYYVGLGSRLERAITNFYLDTHGKRGYKEIFSPFIVNGKSMFGTGNFPKFAEDVFKLEGFDYYLIPTAEVPLTNFHRDEVLTKDELPIKYCGYTACFRAEAGSAGKDTRGLIRQHQFNKVELVKFVAPENSYEELESLTDDAEHVLQLLGLPYRVTALCAGDLGANSAKTYDIEVWMPSYNWYVEISSCSNFEDFQARRANIKFKSSTEEKAKLLHTLNGSGVAIGRTFAAILENFQNEDGSVDVPEALRSYMQESVIKVSN
ncbi:MAG: serine--tRNA ligase [Oscillospiraceae bacterium]|nr:serine--tRNA ligase [Oscillospiraceae bacterium]